MMSFYDEITAFLVASGRRIRERAGRIADIGVVKQYLTEEDLRIENELAALIARHDPSHALYAEEAHDRFADAANLWVADPISGTRTFLEGLGHYAIAVGHLRDGVARFAAVYDPIGDELFTARAGAGATRNGQAIRVARGREGRETRVLYNLAYAEADTDEARGLFGKLAGFDLYRNNDSFALNYCAVACGRYDGVVTCAKDAFPEMATTLILREAGGAFASFKGETTIRPDHRNFVGGRPDVCARIRAALDLPAVS